MAFAHKSPFRELFSQALLRLYENDDLNRLWQKWFIERPSQERQEDGGDACITSFAKRLPKHDPNKLPFENVGGIFIVLQIGIAFACFFAIVEVFYREPSERLEKKANLNLIDSNFPPETRLEQPELLELEDENAIKTHRETEI